MTDRNESPRDADELAAAVAGLGDTPEDALEEIAGRNDSLQERLPGDDLGGGRDDRRNRGTDDDGDDDGLPRGEGAPAQG